MRRGPGAPGWGRQARCEPGCAPSRPRRREAIDDRSGPPRPRMGVVASAARTHGPSCGSCWRSSTLAAMASEHARMHGRPCWGPGGENAPRPMRLDATLLPTGELELVVEDDGACASRPARPSRVAGAVARVPSGRRPRAEPRRRHPGDAAPPAQPGGGAGRRRHGRLESAAVRVLFDLRGRVTVHEVAPTLVARRGTPATSVLDLVALARLEGLSAGRRDLRRVVRAWRWAAGRSAPGRPQRTAPGGRTARPALSR